MPDQMTACERRTSELDSVCSREKKYVLIEMTPIENAFIFKVKGRSSSWIFCCPACFPHSRFKNWGQAYIGASR